MARARGQARGRRTGRRRATAAELEKRHEVVRALLIEGYAAPEIKTLLAKRFECDERQVARYIDDVMARLGEDGADLPTSMLHRLYQRAAKDKKFAAAAGILKRIEDRASRNQELEIALAKLGAPPLDDPLKLQAWSQNIQALELWAAERDPTLSPAERRSLVVKLTRGINSSTPYAELHDARRRLLKDDEDQEKAPSRKMERAPAVATRPLRAEAPRGRAGRRPLRPPPA